MTHGLARWGKIRRPRAWWPRTPVARWEAAALMVVAAAGVLLLSGALADARREYRDGLRRADLREVKAELERWFNDRGGYPLHPSGELRWCGSMDDPDDWLFVDILVADRGWQRSPRDPLATRRWAYRYCPTAAGQPEDRNAPPLATGFFLEARLEQPHEDAAGFNAEHNVFERTFTESGHALYRVCGGTNTECGTARD